MSEDDSGLNPDPAPDMTGKVLQYDHEIYGKEKMTPEDLLLLHERAAGGGLIDQEKLEKHLDEMYDKALSEPDPKALRTLSEEQIAAILGKPAEKDVSVQVDVSPGVPIHCSYFPGAKTADLSVPINVTINEKMESGSISQDLTIPAALYLKTQLEDFIRNYILRVLQP